MSPKTLALVKLSYQKLNIQKFIDLIALYFTTEFDVHLFREVLKEARQIYTQLEKSEYLINHFIHPAWKNNVSIIKDYFKNRFGVDFLKHKVIRSTMFIAAGGDWQRRELEYLESILPAKVLKGYLKETRLGYPTITSLKYLTSHNSIHHLYHLIRFQEMTQKPLDQFECIIEFGGGYGNMAKILRRINPAATYIGLDISLFCCIQYIYLSTLYGRDSVHMFTNEQSELKKGKINLIPVQFTKSIPDQPDSLFISTWGLSESTLAAQSYIDSRSFFGARSILLAFQANNSTFMHAENVKDLLSIRSRNYLIEEIEFLKGNYYLFQ